MSTELHEKRGKLVAQAREALEEIKTNTDEARSAELEQRHDAIMADFDATEKLIERETKLAAIEARAQQAEREREEVRQRLAQYEQPEQQQSQAPDPLSLAKEIAKIERVTEKANSIAKDGATRFENFKAALQVVSREAGPLFDQVGRPTPLGEVCISADDPAALLHYLGSDPDLAAELADLTPIQQARRIARLEMEMSKPKEPPRSNAPKPLKPVKAVSSDVALSDQDSAEAWASKFYALRKQGKPF